MTDVAISGHLGHSDLKAMEFELPGYGREGATKTPSCHAMGEQLRPKGHRERVTSGWWPVTSRVLQGSTLSPVLSSTPLSNAELGYLQSKFASTIRLAGADSLEGRGVLQRDLNKSGSWAITKCNVDNYTTHEHTIISAGVPNYFMHECPCGSLPSRDIQCFLKREASPSFTPPCCLLLWLLFTQNISITSQTPPTSLWKLENTTWPRCKIETRQQIQQ